MSDDKKLWITKTQHIGFPPPISFFLPCFTVMAVNILICQQHKFAKQGETKYKCQVCALKENLMCVFYLKWSERILRYIDNILDLFVFNIVAAVAWLYVLKFC